MIVACHFCCLNLKVYILNRSSEFDCSEQKTRHWQMQLCWGQPLPFSNFKPCTWTCKITSITLPSSSSSMSDLYMLLFICATWLNKNITHSKMNVFSQRFLLWTIFWVCNKLRWSPQGHWGKLQPQQTYLFLMIMDTILPSKKTCSKQ